MSAEDSDGEMQYRCECGAVQYSIPLTGCSVFNTDVMDSILNAAPGATVHYSTTRWISFHKAVGDALAKRPDITLVVDFLSGGYRGGRCSSRSPRGPISPRSSMRRATPASCSLPEDSGQQGAAQHRTLAIDLRGAAFISRCCRKLNITSPSLKRSGLNQHKSSDFAQTQAA